MPITDLQRRQRKNFVGSSEAAAIVGFDPWHSILDVYLEKTMELYDWDGNDATKVGNLVERSILDWGAAELNARIIKNQYRVLKEGPAKGIMAANCDALIPSLNAVLEGKVTANSDQWGESGTDLVPDHVNIQVHHQMKCAGAEKAFVVALIVGFGFNLRLYEIARNEALIDILAAKIRNFWELNVKAGVPPVVESFPSLEIIRRIRRVPEKIVELDEKAAAIIARWRMWNGFRLTAEKTEKQAKAATLALLGDGEGGLLPDGRLLTFMEQTRKGYSVSEKTYRVARIVKAPKQITQG